MRSRKIVVIILALALIGSLAVACTTTEEPTPTSPPAEKIIWKFQSITAADATGGKSDAWFCNEVTKRTNGRLTIEHYPQVGLGVPVFGTLPAMREGLLEGACAFSVYLGAEVPIMDIMGLPNICEDDMELKKEISDALLPYQIEAMSEKDVVLLGSFCTTGRNYYTIEKLTSADQLKGLKVRTAGPPEAAVAEALGAIATTLPSADIYTGLERGIVDAVSMPSNGITEWKLDDFLTTCFPFRTVFTPWDLIISAEAFNELPDDIKQIVMDTGKEAYDLGWEWDVELSDNADEVLKAGGMVFIEVTPETMDLIATGSDAYNAAWLEKAGPEGTEMMDLVKQIIADYGS